MGVVWVEGDWTDFPDELPTYGNLDELDPDRYVHDTPEEFQGRLPSGGLVTPPLAPGTTGRQTDIF